VLSLTVQVFTVFSFFAVDVCSLAKTESKLNPEGKRRTARGAGGRAFGLRQNCGANYSRHRFHRRGHGVARIELNFVIEIAKLELKTS